MDDNQIKTIFVETKKIEGWFTEENIRLLAPYVYKLPKNALVVEIGTYHGKSTLCWRLANPQVRILTVDICSKAGLGTQPNQINSGAIVPKKIDRAVLAKGNILQIAGSSHTVVKRFNWPIDFLFIDSIHSYQDTLDNLREWGKFVKRGHFIACHDYDQNSWPGVVKAVADYLKSHPKVKLISTEGGVAILKSA